MRRDTLCRIVHRLRSNLNQLCDKDEYHKYFKAATELRLIYSFDRKQISGLSLRRAKIYSPRWKKSILNSEFTFEEIARTFALTVNRAFLLYWQWFKVSLKLKVPNQNLDSEHNTRPIKLCHEIKDCVILKIENNSFVQR